MGPGPSVIHAGWFLCAATLGQSLISAKEDPNMTLNHTLFKVDHVDRMHYVGLAVELAMLNAFKHGTSMSRFSL